MKIRKNPKFLCFAFVLAFSLLFLAEGNILQVQATQASGSGWELKADGTLTFNDPNGLASWAGSNNSPGSNPSDKVTSVEFPSGITTIPANAFLNCVKLTSITIPDTVTTIGALAFQNSGLTSVTIPSSVVTIENNAFTGCSSLASVTLSKGVVTIGPSAFYACSQLQSITIPASVQKISGEAFANTAIQNVTFVGNTPPTIEINAFLNTSTQLGITVPAGQEAIYEQTLSNTVLGVTSFTVNNGSVLAPATITATLISANSSGCSHNNIGHMEHSPATAEKNAQWIAFCNDCKEILLYYDASNTAHLQFMLDLIKDVKNSPGNGSVTVNTELWHSVNKFFVDSLADRRDVSITINYKYEGKYYTVTIPPNYDLSALLDENGWIGFRRLDAEFNGSEIEAW